VESRSHDADYGALSYIKQDTCTSTARLVSNS